ncbi:MAG: hypothetical protein PSY12_09980 [bacterium]|nr:hypothetical protein [bacterium]
MRIGASPSYLAAINRWEDPGGRLQLEMWGKYRQDPSGELARQYLDTLPNKEAVGLLLAPANIASDWLATADFFANLKGVSSEAQSNMLDVVIGHWTVKEGADVATAWLEAHAYDPRYDQARLTVFLASKGKSPSLLESMASKELAEQGQLIVKAYAR